MDGELGVTSQPQKGSTFFFTLTLREADPNQRASSAKELSNKDVPSMRILIIEDEVKTADYLHQGLTESGYIVDRANDGIDGLHMALQHPYELVILDVNLPGIDGWDLLRRLRERSSARVMMLTGHGRLTDKVRGLDLGADDFMVKPFQFPELLARVRSLLRRHDQAPMQDVLRVADLELDGVTSSFVGPFGAIGAQRDIVEQAWDLAEVENAYEEFLDAFATADPTTPAGVLAHQIHLVHAWRRFPFLDPQLPTELLPEHWAGARAAARFTELHGRWHRPAQQQWQRLVGTAS